jgi:hypothetical protein
MHTTKFPLGHIVMTNGIRSLLAAHQTSVNVLAPLLVRHQSGDWGEVDDGDKRQNDLSVHDGFRVLSAYRLCREKVWIITEADRSVTTVLLPDEY